MTITVDVKTPGNGKTYEFLLDTAMKVGQAKNKMIEEILEAENGNIALDPQNALLANGTAGVILMEGDSIWASGIKGGQTLLLL